MERIIRITLLASVFLFAQASAAAAGMGNIATSYGVLPSDMASAQALSMFNTQPSAAYYNPASLVEDARGQFCTGLFYADHELEAKSRGGSAPPEREGKVLNDTPSKNVLLGMKTDLSDLTKQDHPISFGFIAGLEKYGMEMLSFSSRTSRQGQYFKYDRQPMFIRLGAGTRVWKGIDAGLGISLELHNEASLKTRSTFAGETDYESLKVSAEPDLQAIFGLRADLEELFCSWPACWAKGLEAAFSYREASFAKTAVKAETYIPGTIVEDEPMSLNVSTIDSYKPEIIAAAVSWEKDPFRAGFSLEQQRWSDLEGELADDIVKDQAKWDFSDILVPRLGVQYSLSPDYTVTAGAAYEQSPLENTRSLNVNYLDSDRWIFGLGLSALFQDPWILSYPVRLDIGYQYHMLEDRDFELTHENAPENPYETVSAQGQVHVLAGSVTLTF